MKLLLQHKIFVGYFLLIAIIGGMFALVVYERDRMWETRNKYLAIFHAQRDIDAVYRNITALATYGESVSAWSMDDSLAYRFLRARTDSLLSCIRSRHELLAHPRTLDSLRALLAQKESFMFQIMNTSKELRNADSLLSSRLTDVMAQSESPRVVTRRKKGIAGFFGIMETVQLPPVPDRRNMPDKESLFWREERIRLMNAYADSMRISNRLMAKELGVLIANLEEGTWNTLLNREAYLKSTRGRSILITGILIICSIILLLVLFLITQRDIKEKTKNRRHLENTIKQNTELLEMQKNIILTISHDVRAPLNIISGSAELAMDIREKKRRNAHLRNISIVCRRMVHLLNNLLDVYRLNDSKEKRNDVPFNLNDLLERCVFGFSLPANNKGLLFNHNFKHTRINLCGDEDRVEQIIGNLLGNAVKFTEIGTVGLDAEFDGEKLILEVKDTGIGMDKETLSRIFRPFERLSTIANPDGFGLGLPITKGLVNLLGGTIDVESEIGRGSTFRVTLPMKTTDEPVANENRKFRNPTRLPRNVLVIDDDAMLLDVIKEMLERNGINCTACVSTRELVKVMRGKDYDLILSDIQMPGTNGFDLLALLRNSNIGNSRTIPVVAMTARGDRESEALLCAGFTDCIYKPFSSSELLCMLSTITRSRHEEKQNVDFDLILSEVNDKPKTLLSFIFQSEKDRKELGIALKNRERQKLREITHRMQPMWELLQSGKILQGYRDLLDNENVSDSVLGEYTKQIMNYSALLVKMAETEFKRLTNETENTDS